MSTQPDYTVSPGAFLRDWMDENGLTRQHLAERMGIEIDLLSSVLGDDPLAADVAEKLSAVTGYTTRWWLKVEAQYRADVTRIAAGLEAGSLLYRGESSATSMGTKFLNFCSKP